MIRFFEKFGIPRVLLLGFLAVAIFMTGDGFELTFLSKFMVDQGFSSSQASLLVTVPAGGSASTCCFSGSPSRVVCIR